MLYHGIYPFPYMVNYINDHAKRTQQLTDLCESGELDCMPMGLKSLLFELIEELRVQDLRLIELEHPVESTAWGKLTKEERDKVIKEAQYGV